MYILYIQGNQKKKTGPVITVCDTVASGVQRLSSVVRPSVRQELTSSLEPMIRILSNLAGSIQ